MTFWTSISHGHVKLCSQIREPPTDPYHFSQKHNCLLPNNTIAKGFNQIAPLVCYRQTYHLPSQSLSQTISRDAKHIQHLEIINPNNWRTPRWRPINYLIYTQQTYHHPLHRYRWCPMQMISPSHPHTLTRVQLNLT